MSHLFIELTFTEDATMIIIIRQVSSSQSLAEKTNKQVITVHVASRVHMQDGTCAGRGD